MECTRMCCHKILNIILYILSQYWLWLSKCLLVVLVALPAAATATLLGVYVRGAGRDARELREAADLPVGGASTIVCAGARRRAAAGHLARGGRALADGSQHHHLQQPLQSVGAFVSTVRSSSVCWLYCTSTVLFHSSKVFQNRNRSLSAFECWTKYHHTFPALKERTILIRCQTFTCPNVNVYDRFSSVALISERAAIELTSISTTVQILYVRTLTVYCTGCSKRRETVCLHCHFEKLHIIKHI